MVSKYEPPQLDPSKWFMWIEYPGYTYEDITAWKLEIDSEGQIVQILYDKAFCWGEPRESYVVQLCSDELQEIHRRIDEINFPRLQREANYFFEKDSDSCHVQIRTKDSLIDIQTTLPIASDVLSRKISQSEMLKPTSGTEIPAIKSIHAELRELVSLLELILSRCPIQRWHWLSE